MYSTTAYVCPRQSLRYIKEQVYKEDILNIARLKQKIIDEFIRPKSDNALNSVQTSLISRAH